MGEKGALSLQPGWAAETGRLSRLEVVEVSSATAAAGEPLLSNFSRLTPLYALRCRILQSGDTKRLDEQHTVNTASKSVWCHSPEYVSHFSHRWRVAADSVHAERDMHRRGKGARHRSLDVFQATLCVCPQVRLTLIIRALSLYPKPNITAVSLLTSTFTQTVKQNVSSSYLIWVTTQCLSSFISRYDITELKLNSGRHGGAFFTYYTSNNLAF